MPWAKLAVDEITEKYKKDGFVKSFRSRFSKKPLPVVLGPTKWKKKAYYLKDNHHMVIPVANEFFSGSISNDESLVCVVIEADTSHLKWADFVFDLYIGSFGSHLGYLDPETQVLLSKSHATEFQTILMPAYEDLFSRNLNQLEDLPFRSVAADVMSMKLGIKGSNFKECIEFFLAERVQDVLEKSVDPASEKERLLVFKAMFGNPEVLVFLKSQLRPELEPKKRDEIIRNMDLATKFYLDELTKNPNAPASEMEQVETLNHFFSSFKTVLEQKASKVET